MLRGEAYFVEAEAENNNGGSRLTKRIVLNWLQKYFERDVDHPEAPWPVSKALKLLAGIRPDAFIDTGFDPGYPLDEEDERLLEVLDEASQALALVLNDCEDVKNRKKHVRFFELERFRFALRIDDDVDLLKPADYFTRIANDKLPLRLYHKVGAVLFSHEYFSRDVPIFGLFHDFTLERDGRAAYEVVDAQIWDYLQRTVYVEACREAEKYGIPPWDVNCELPPFVEPVFSNNPRLAACSLLPPPPSLPSEYLEIERGSREVEPAPVAAAPSVVPDVEEISADLSAAIDFGAATRDVLDVLADYLKRPPERRKSGKPAFHTEAQCVLDALDVKAKRNGWGTGDDGRLSQAQWIGVRLLFLPPTENKGCKGSRWGGNTDRDPKK